MLIVYNAKLFVSFPLDFVMYGLLGFMFSFDRTGWLDYFCCFVLLYCLIIPLVACGFGWVVCLLFVCWLWLLFMLDFMCWFLGLFCGCGLVCYLFVCYLVGLYACWLCCEFLCLVCFMWFTWLGSLPRVSVYGLFGLLVLYDCYLLMFDLFGSFVV